MAESIWQKGKLNAVYVPAGMRANGSPRFRRANFDLLSWAASASGPESIYIATIGDRVSANAINNAEENLGSEFGFYELEPIVIEPHQADGSDSWIGLHTMGAV